MEKACSDEYLAWIEKEGIKLHGISAAMVAHGWRGVVATARIEPGHTLLEVPEHCLMTRRSAESDGELMAALRKHPGLGSVQVADGEAFPQAWFHEACEFTFTYSEGRSPWVLAIDWI